jgi:hypothetical protein
MLNSDRQPLWIRFGTPSIASKATPGSRILGRSTRIRHEDLSGRWSPRKEGVQASQSATTTAHHVLQALKEFLAWLQGRQGYRRRINIADIAYLNLTANEERAAHASRPKLYATLDQYRAALFAMPTENEAERRDQALFAILLLTGMRDTAAVSLKLKHVSIERRRVFQDPREVRTKFAKAIETYFFPAGEDVTPIVIDWVQYLTIEKLFGPADPLFPKTAVQHDASQLHGPRPNARALGQCLPGPPDLQKRLRASGLALCEAAFGAQHAHPTCLQTATEPGTTQGLGPKFWGTTAPSPRSSATAQFQQNGRPRSSAHSANPMLPPATSRHGRRASEGSSCAPRFLCTTASRCLQHP